MDIIIVIAITVVVLLILPLFLSNEYNVTRETTIQASKQHVFEYIRYTRNHLTFNKWWMMDPAMKIEFRGTDGSTGFVAAWDSSMKRGPGAGEQETAEIVEGKSISWDIRFFKPFVSATQSVIKTEAKSDQETRVVWTFKGKRNYSMKFFHFFFKITNMLGKELQSSLTNLKTILEK